MKTFFTILFTFLLSCTGFSQDIITEEIEHTPAPLMQADELPVEGTYQIVLTNTTTTDVIIPEKLLFEVNKKRKAEEVVYIIVDKNTKIKILPYSIIYAKDFVPEIGRAHV